MKNLLIAILSTLSLTATATPSFKLNVLKSASEQACDKIENAYWNLCAHALCDDEVAQGNFNSFKDCTNASDAGEAIQAACEDQEETLESLLAKYNEANQVNLQCGF